MVSVAVDPFAMVVPTGFDKVKLIVSASSNTKSAFMGMLKLLGVMSPSAQLSVPEAAA